MTWVWVGLAAVLAGGAAGLAVPAPGLRRGRPGRSGVREASGSPLIWVVASGAVLVCAVGVWAGPSAGAVAACAAMLTGTVGGLTLRHGRRRAAGRRADEVARAGQVLAGLLRVGQIPVVALDGAAEESAALREAVAVRRVGGEVPGALRRAGESPGGEGLVDLARAWEVSERTGASMCAAIEATAERLAAEHETERTVSAELSAPRASGRLMGALPLVGVLLGYGFGGDPLRFLTGTAVGNACLVAGVGLACAGVWWTDRIADGGVR